MRTTLLATALSLTLAGCVSQADQTGSLGLARIGAPEQAVAVETGWRMPWELNPSAQDERARAAALYEIELPGTGRVRGTAETIRYAAAPLPRSRGPNRTLAACRAAVEGEARKQGAVRVEAASLAAERRARTGQYFAPVGFRVTYRREDGGFEMRQSVLACVTKPDGQIVDAYVPEGFSEGRFASFRQAGGSAAQD